MVVLLLVLLVCLLCYAFHVYFFLIISCHVALIVFLALSRIACCLSSPSLSFVSPPPPPFPYHTLFVNPTLSLLVSVPTSVAVVDVTRKGGHGLVPDPLRLPSRHAARHGAADLGLVALRRRFRGKSDSVGVTLAVGDCFCFPAQLVCRRFYPQRPSGQAMLTRVHTCTTSD